MQQVSEHRFRLTLGTFIGVCFLVIVGLWLYKPFNSSADEKHSAPLTRLSTLPSTILWAWERPEKLDYIDGQKVAVAFLAKTIYLRGDNVVSRPRLQPLAIRDGSPVIAVARIESERNRPATLSPQQIKDTALAIFELSSLPNVVMVQVDFDATLTERSFYRAVLSELRAKLPESTLLSITALASWCKGDNWLDALPIDEAVPMLFRMGAEREQFISQLAAGEKFNARLCQASVGVSTDEPLAQLPPVQRVYFFNPASWTPAELNRVMETNKK